MVQQFFLFCGSQQFFHVSLCAKITWIPQLAPFVKVPAEKISCTDHDNRWSAVLGCRNGHSHGPTKPQGEEYVFSLTNMVKWKFQLVTNVMYPQQYINHQPCNRPAANRQWISPMPSDEPLACLLHKKPEVSGTKMLFWMHTKIKKFRLFCCTLFF